MKSIHERVENIFKKVFDDNNFKITKDLSPENYEKWDSIHTVFILGELEKEFNTTFSTQDVSEFTSTSRIIEIVKKNIEEQLV